MGEVDAKTDRVTRSELRHDRHTVSLLTDHLVVSPNLSLGKNALPKKHGFPQLKEWSPDHRWAPSCFHGSVGHGWVVARCIEGQEGYEKTDTVPVVVIDEEKERPLKTGYITLYTKLFTVTGPVS